MHGYGTFLESYGCSPVDYSLKLGKGVFEEASTVVNKCATCCPKPYICFAPAKYCICELILSCERYEFMPFPTGSLHKMLLATLPYTIDIWKSGMTKSL